MMMKTSTILLAIALASTALPAAAQQSSNVAFARGTSSAQIPGTIRGREYRDYIVRAAAGQRIRINLAARSASPYFNLMPPGSSGEAVHIGSSAGNSYEGVLDRGGQWTIRVYQMRSAERRGTVAAYRLSLAVLGRAAPGRPGDAMVPGTSYNATGPVDCLLNPGAPYRQCNAGVRRLGNGSAIVEIEIGAGGKRRIEFRNGQPVTSNMGSVSYSMNNGMYEVRVGGETYRIVDAFIFGG